MENFLINSSYLPLNEELSKWKNIYAIVDSNLFSTYSSLISGIFRNIYLFESSEENKNLESVAKITSWLLEKNAGRDSLLVGIGGGITTDITGFVAAIYKRGIRYALIPTSLTAQIDAAIGGKTGINFANLKNVLGTFSRAEFIYINGTFLQSLPTREFYCGAAEMFKTFIIADKEAFISLGEILSNSNCERFPIGSEITEYAVQTPDSNSSEKETPLKEVLSSPGFSSLTARAISIKSEIVESDRTEKGNRALLNLGHTFGHAIESCCNFFSPETDICNHGEAVAAGIMVSARLSLKKGLLPQQEYDLIVNTLKGCNYRTINEIAKAIPGTVPNEFADKLLHFIANDKKCKEDFIKFVFIIGVGNVTIESIPLKSIEYIINDLCNDK